MLDKPANAMDENRAGSTTSPLEAGAGVRFRSLDEAPCPPDTERGLRLKVLFLADDRHAAQVVQDHVGGIGALSRHNIITVNPIHDDVAVANDPSIDIFLIHYSIFILGEYFLPKPWRERLAADRRPKVQIIQDEHRHIERMKRAMADLGVRAVLSSLSTQNLPKVYFGGHLEGTHFYSCIPGYIAPSMHGQVAPPIAARPLHVVYRGRDLPFKLGRFPQEKERIGRQMKAIAGRAGLHVDIEWEEGKRIYGPAWGEFLKSGRATIAVEGGASIFDFDDELDAKITKFLEAHPGADFETVWLGVLWPYEGNVLHKTITPKLLESIALKTALILYPGEYRGVLEAGRHYIEFDPEGRNADEVVARIRDAAFLQKLVDRTYDEIMTRADLQKSFYVGRLDRIMHEAWSRGLTWRPTHPNQGGD